MQGRAVRIASTHDTNPLPGHVLHGTNPVAMGPTPQGESLIAVLDPGKDVAYLTPKKTSS